MRPLMHNSLRGIDITYVIRCPDEDGHTYTIELGIHFNNPGHVEESKERLVGHCFNNKLKGIRRVCDTVKAADYGWENGLSANCRDYA